MYIPMMANLRYGKLSNGTKIPGAYALERKDGKSILFHNGNDFASLAYYLGASVDPDGYTYEELMENYDNAVEWLDERINEEFDIYANYGDLPEEAWE